MSVSKVKDADNSWNNKVKGATDIFLFLRGLGLSEFSFVSYYLVVVFVVMKLELSPVT